MYPSPMSRAQCSAGITAGGSNTAHLPTVSSEAGCKEAVERVYKNDNVKFRLTLTGFDKAFGKRA